MASQKPSIGFIGLGAMGFGMATHLLKQGHKVNGFDVWPPTLDRFRAAGGDVVSTPGDAARGSDYCICMVASAPQAQSALFEVDDPAVKALPKNATLLLCSTVPSAYAKSVQSQLDALNRTDVYFIDCPVSGGTARAASGELTIMAGGSAEALTRGRFLLDELTAPSKLYIVAGGIGAGSNMKMLHQVLAGTHVLAASEAMGFAARLGLDARATYAKVCEPGQQAWSWMFENRMPRALDEEYVPAASALTIMLKDLGIITSTARISHFPTPLSAIAEQLFILGVAHGFASHDDSSMVRLYYPDPITKVSGVASSEKEALVLDLLSAVHLCAAAEALSLASHLGIDLAQFYDLASTAAGGSWQFQHTGKDIMAVLEGEPAATSTVALDARIAKLEHVVLEAKKVDCPVFLASEALSVLLLARNKSGSAVGEAEGLVGVWRAK